MVKLCKCGCGKEIIPQFHHKYYGVPDYIIGHHRKGKSNHWSIKEKIKPRTARTRATKICKKIKCFIDNEQCSKRLEVHHKDKNPFNNNKDNLVCLCTTHHRIVESKKRTIEELKKTKLSYYIDKSGKRRYNWTK